MTNLDNKSEWREGLADAEARIERLETALAAVVRALAYGGASYPYPNTTPLHKHRLCGSETARYLAAKTLSIDIGLELDQIEPRPKVTPPAEETCERDEGLERARERERQFCDWVSGV